MRKKRGAKGKIEKQPWQSDCRYRKPTWFEQQAQMVNHEIPE
jgi:hypothetical protein